MGHFKGCHGERAHDGRFVGLQVLQHDIAQTHQLVPGPVGEEKGRHGGHGVDRHPLGAHALETQIHQPGIVADMAVGEENPIQPRPLAC